MGVELAGDEALAARDHIVPAEQGPDDLGHFALADPLLAAHHERGAGLLLGVLHYVREPRLNPAEERIIALADVVPQVGEEPRAVARGSLDGKATPEVVMIRRCPARGEDQPLVLPPLRVLQPAIGQTFALTLCVRNTLVGEPHFERAGKEEIEVSPVLAQPSALLPTMIRA